MASGQDAGEPRTRLAVRLTVAAVAARALAPAAHAAHAGADLAARYRTADGPERRVVAAMEYLGAEMDRRVPKGSRVYLDEPDEVWRFRLQELATMHTLVPAPDQARAEFLLRRRAEPAAPAGVAHWATVTFIYLISPYPIEWHLFTSADRVTIVLAMLACVSAACWLAVALAPAAASPQSTGRRARPMPPCRSANSIAARDLCTAAVRDRAAASPLSRATSPAA